MKEQDTFTATKSLSNMADAWAQQMLAAPGIGHLPENRKVIETLRSLLQRSISPQQAAGSLAAAYDARIRSGKTDTYPLWGIYCTAIAAMGDDQSNRDLLVQTPLCVSWLPDVIDDKGQPVTENHHVFWREVPEFTFWMSQGIASK